MCEILNWKYHISVPMKQRVKKKADHCRCALQVIDGKIFTFWHCLSQSSIPISLLPVLIWGKF